MEGQERPEACSSVSTSFLDSDIAIADGCASAVILLNGKSGLINVGNSVIVCVAYACMYMYNSLYLAPV